MDRSNPRCRNERKRDVEDGQDEDRNRWNREKVSVSQMIRSLAAEHIITSRDVPCFRYFVDNRLHPLSSNEIETHNRRDEDNSMVSRFLLINVFELP